MTESWEPPGRPTYSVAQLTGEIREFLAEGFWSVRVVGEVQRPVRSRAGHLYLELVEKGRGDAVLAKLDAAIFRSGLYRIEGRLRRAGQRLEAGQRIRCEGRIDFYAPTGKLQLIIQDIDPDFTLGELERRRRKNLARLGDAGLLERNRSLVVPSVPLRLGLVTSHGSAAYHDFLSSLRASGFGFQVVFVHASVQGQAAEHEVPSALALLARAQLDAVAVVRGGGARSDLAAFDAFAICEAVACCDHPVFTGLGHEIDRSLTDRVAHTSLKTPTQVAETIVDRVQTADRRLEEARAALGRAARARLDAARRRVDQGRQIARLAHLRIGSAHSRVAELRTRLERTSQRRLESETRRLRKLETEISEAAERPLRRAAQRPEEIARRIMRLARARLLTAGARVEGLDRVARSLAPERVLERGYSLTRNAQGRTVRSVTEVAIGDTITTRFTDGTVDSRVEKT